MITGEPRWVDRTDELEALVDELLAEPRYALDTEFHRERTYYPKLALVQVAWSGGLALIDPLAADVSGLARLFASDVLVVIHAAQQDLDVLSHAVGAVPTRMYDTQLAAGFVGYGTPSLVSLLQGELDLSPAKGDRLTDWLQRPLTPEQLAYAASDVAHLLQLHELLDARLVELGRAGWVEDACRELLARPVSGAAPDDAWMKLKDTRSLRPKGRAVACAVAAWRERRAMELDVPVRQVLPDLAVLGIAQKLPTTVDELRSTRGVEPRAMKGALAEELLAAVRRGLSSDPPIDVRGRSDDLDRELRPAVALVSAWVSQVARRERIDTAMLATRNDLIALLSGRPDARLTQGWRAELLGDDIRDLLAGRAALTFAPGEGSDASGLRLVRLDGSGSA